MKKSLFSPFRSEFAKNSLTLLTGSFVGQAMALLAYPVITRLFSQSDIGLYATWLSIVDVLTILSTGKYEDSVMLGKDKTEAVATARLALMVNTAFSLAAVAVAAAVFAYGKTDYTVFFIPPMIFFCGTSRVYQALFNYVKKFGHIAFSNIANSVAATAAKIACGLARFTSGTLPAGSLVGQIVGNINYQMAMHRLQLPQTTWAEAKAMAKERRNFPLFSMPKNFVNSFSHNLPFIFLAAYFDKAYIGLFSIAMMCTFRPVSFFASAYHKVLYKNLSEKYHSRQSLKKDIIRFVYTNVLLFVPVFVIGGVFAQWLLGTIFGNEWQAAAPYLRMVLPWIFLTLFVSTLSFLPDMFSTQRTDLIINIITFAVRFSALAVGIAYDNFMLAIALFAGVSTIMSVVNLAWYYRLVQRYEKSLS